MYGKEDILKNLPNQNHKFLEGQYPYTINPGGPNHEELVSLIGIYDYFMDLYSHHFKDNNLSVRQKINQINNLIAKHEEEVANPILHYINSRDDFKLIGENLIIKIVHQLYLLLRKISAQKNSAKNLLRILLLLEMITFMLGDVLML